MKRTGEMLRKAREDKGLSLNEISLSLKISTKVLSAIEDGDLEKLPAKTFLRGFVQSYANFLKIRTDEVMAVFSEEMGGPRPASPASGEEGSAEAAETQAPVAHREEPVLSEMEKRNNTKLIVISAICVVLVFLIFVTARIVDRYQKETITGEVQISSPLHEETPEKPDEDETAKDDDKDEGEAVTTASPAAEASLPPATTPPPAPNPGVMTAAPQTSAAPAPKPAPPAAASTPPAASQAATPPAAAPQAPATPPPAPATTAAAEKKPSGKPLEMIIEALDNVEIEYGSRSGEMRKVQLGPDRVHTIRSQEGLRLKISNGGAVNLNLNGRDLGVPGDLGKSIQLSY